MQPSLSEIAQRLINKDTSSREVESTLTSYKDLLVSKSLVDVDGNEHDQHLQLDSGIAIGLKWAAACLDDAIRTVKFIRGTRRAILQKLEEGNRPVRLVYAGTGPFATLIFPLLDQFSSEELQVTLIEINPNSAKNVEHLVQSFGLGDRVESIICADATSVILSNHQSGNGEPLDLQYDILLSETMQHALQAELQVVICAHLLNQMPENTLLIPQSIDLDLIRMQLDAGNFRSVERIGELMNVDAPFLRKESPIDSEWEYKKHFDVSNQAAELGEFLGISTTIQVFEEETIHQHESGLTVPKVLAPVEDVMNQTIECCYKISPEPGFEFTFLPKS